MADSPDNSETPPWPEEENAGHPSPADLEAAGQAAMFGNPSPAPETKPEPAPAAAQPYRVLARKYRPQTFSELIGQDAMVQTLANAIKRDRLAHAFLMTGVRGVGKTSTARLIAKALNCVGPDGEGGPTISPCGVCEPCRAIAEGRHIDVIEMDAASHTGVDDVREIIEAVRYAAVSARYKIYIIDEVHMLSKNAFNALLKTLEEPPAHVKFLFATTEVNKVPITVLSRCQRFDLKRIPSSMLAEHFASVCMQEGVSADQEALALIAEAAQGSVRDGLSILDQAMAHADLDGGGAIGADQVRQMLGLSDRSAMRRLFGAIVEGDGPQLLEALGQQHKLGVDPVAVMRGLLSIVHAVTLHKSAPVNGSATFGEEDRAALAQWSTDMGFAQLHRLWQLLLKGHDEVETAPVPQEAAEMALLRVLHAATMPDPGTLARRMAEAPPTESSPAMPSAPAKQDEAVANAASRPHIDSLETLAEALDGAGRLILLSQVETQLRPISIRPGEILYRSADGRDDFAPALRDALLELTGERWRIEPGEGEGQPTLAEARDAAQNARRDEILNHPLVQAARKAFPDAELVEPDLAEDDTMNRSAQA